MTFAPGQLIRHENEDDPRGHLIEGIVLRAAPERGEGFYQVLVLEQKGYFYSVARGRAVVTKLTAAYMNWRVVA